MSLIQGKTGEWEVVIGLEVHAQAIAESKLFSGAATTFGAAPNTQVSLVDAAMPGMLPVLNRRALEQAVKTGLGLNAKINLESVFERKNYFYPDLPQGYQISQYLQPIVGAGRVMLDLPDGATKDVAVERLHLEEDAGKSLHDQHPSETYIDLNRAGVTLMEIVSKPDLRSAEEAGAYLEKLRSILRYLGTCTGNMEEGSMRCDVNLSVRRPGADLGTRTETKNVNSIRFVKQAIEYEAKRQVALIEDGGTVEQETRLFDPDKGTTRAMRSKEEAHDYRYFPDPDLLPVVLEADWVEALRRALPELPDAKKARFLRNYQLSPYQAAILVSDKDLADAFEETVHGVLRRKLEDNEASSAISFSIDPNANIDSSPYGLVVESSAASSAKMILGDVFKVANETGQDPAALIRRLDLRGLMQLIDDDIISGRLAKDVFQAMCETGQHAAAIVEAKGLRQISDAGAIETIVESVVADNPEQAAQFRAGNEKVLGWLVGQVMKASQGRANPAMVNRLLRQKLA